MPLLAGLWQCDRLQSTYAMQILNVGAGQTETEYKTSQEQRRADSGNDANLLLLGGRSARARYGAASSPAEFRGQRRHG
jgi:hypothetical protein